MGCADLPAGLRRLSSVVARVEGSLQARHAPEEGLALRELVEELQELEPGADAWWARFLALEDSAAAPPRQQAPAASGLSSCLRAPEREELRQALRAVREALGPAGGLVSGSQRLPGLSRGDT